MIHSVTSSWVVCCFVFVLDGRRRDWQKLSGSGLLSQQKSVGIFGCWLQKILSALEKWMGNTGPNNGERYSMALIWHNILHSTITRCEQMWCDRLGKHMLPLVYCFLYFFPLEGKTFSSVQWVPWSRRWKLQRFNGYLREWWWWQRMVCVVVGGNRRGSPSWGPHCL